MCLTLVREGFLGSAKRALRAASQSNGECTDLALKGDRAVLALRGESMLDAAGDGGIFRLGKAVAPVGGADMGSCAKGLGGTAGAVRGGCFVSSLHEQSDRSLLAVDGTDSGVASPDSVRLQGTTGEFSDMDRRKSVYAVGGLMGVLRGLISNLHDNGRAESGVLTDNSEGKVPVMGVASWASLGLTAAAAAAVAVAVVVVVVVAVAVAILSDPDRSERVFASEVHTTGR